MPLVWGGGGEAEVCELLCRGLVFWFRKGEVLSVYIWQVEGMSRGGIYLDIRDLFPEILFGFG